MKNVFHPDEVKMRIGINFWGNETIYFYVEGVDEYKNYRLSSETHYDYIFHVEIAHLYDYCVRSKTVVFFPFRGNGVYLHFIDRKSAMVAFYRIYQNYCDGIKKLIAFLQSNFFKGRNVFYSITGLEDKKDLFVISKDLKIIYFYNQKSRMIEIEFVFKTETKKCEFSRCFVNLKDFEVLRRMILSYLSRGEKESMIEITGSRDRLFNFIVRNILVAK